MLLDDLQGVSSGYTKMSVLDVLTSIIFLGSLVLATALICGIIYGTCRRDGSQHEQIENVPQGGKGTKQRKEEAKKGTAEEKRSLAAAEDDEDDEDDGRDDVERAGGGAGVATRAVLGGDGPSCEMD